jgi:hypothetical protein
VPDPHAREGVLGLEDGEDGIDERLERAVAPPPARERLGAAVARQLRDEHPAASGERRRDRLPVPRPAAEPVDEDDGRAGAADEVPERPHPTLLQIRPESFGHRHAKGIFLW